MYRLRFLHPLPVPREIPSEIPHARGIYSTRTTTTMATTRDTIEAIELDSVLSSASGGGAGVISKQHIDLRRVQPQPHHSRTLTTATSDDDGACSECRACVCVCV